MDESIANEEDLFSTLSNAELWELVKILRSNKGGEFTGFSKKQVARFQDILPKFNLFLWRGSRHETPDPNVAWHAVQRAKLSFYDRIGLNPSSTADGGAVTRSIIWRLHTPRSWLLKAVRRSVQECRQEQEKGRLADAPKPPESAMLPPNPGYVWLAANACELKRHRRPPKLIADGHCRRACDLLFMQDLELSHREMGYVLNIPKSSAFERLIDCEAQLP